MFWHLIQQAEIVQAQSDADSAKSTAADAQAGIRLHKVQIQKLEETIERPSLATIAVVEILND